MMEGLMQQTPLQIASILRYAETAHGSREIVSRQTDGGITRYDFREFAKRCRQLAGLLESLGVKAGDRVSSLAWNSSRHLELLYAVPCMGAVLHTANPRLFDEQIRYTINHAGSEVLFFDPNLSDLVARLAPMLPKLKIFVAMEAQPVQLDGVGEARSYEQLLSCEAGDYEWPVFDENSGAVLCYTSGTTGDPKGVLYSHRAIVLHAMASGLSSAFGLTAFDVVMPCASLYHATAWGLPYAALLCGAKFVLPHDRFDPASLHALIEGEGVTFTGGVPTIWTLYLTWLEEQKAKPGRLDRVIIGGSAVPRSMAEAFGERHGVKVLQVWGMTETCPIGVVATPTPALADMGEDFTRETIWTRQGRLQFGIELKIMGEDGESVPPDGEASGAVLVRGPWTIRRYYQAEADVAAVDGWFDTGDIATLDPRGFMRITDRKKDVIKSGGEWISSIDLENLAIGCPDVRVAAVIGVSHPKWEERPLLILETREGTTLSKGDVLDFLAPQIAKWWLPDDVIFAAIPLTATGKVDKKALRQTYANHLM